VDGVNEKMLSLYRSHWSTMNAAPVSDNTFYRYLIAIINFFNKTGSIYQEKRFVLFSPQTKENDELRKVAALTFDRHRYHIR